MLLPFDPLNACLTLAPLALTPKCRAHQPQISRAAVDPCYGDEGYGSFARVELRVCRV